MLMGSPPPVVENDAAEQIAVAERLLRQGEPLLAYNAAAIGLLHDPRHSRLRQLQALALARGGDVERANRLLSELTAEGVDDAETQGVLARTHKDLGLAAREPEPRAKHFAAAFSLYHGAYAVARRRGATAAAYYTGINAATVAVLRGDLDTAREIAADVVEVCDADARANAAAPDDFWRRATLGEGALILGRIDAAAAHYAAAVALAQNRFGDLSSTRRQARLLAGYLGLDTAWLAQVLQVPPVVVFTGHHGETAESAEARFPAEFEPHVREGLHVALSTHRPLAVYGCAAAGSEILCLEVAHELGAETHVVLPFPAAEFRRDRVDVMSGDWGARFDRLLATANSVTITSDHRASGSAATYRYASSVTAGLGRLRAQLLDTTTYALTLRQRQGVPVDQLAMEIELQSLAVSPVRHTHGGECIDGGQRSARHEIKSLLFADAVGYSRLSEDQIPGYVSGFLQAVADLNQRTRHRCEHVETAGDGLYMVFASTTDAAHYALELNALVCGTDWAAQGLPADFNLRIALHCGPVFCGRDPITGLGLYTGPHVSRTARIEPITPPGQVYASSAFAAVAAADGVAGIDWRYVGRIPLAKRSGSLTLYHLQTAS